MAKKDTSKKQPSRNPAREKKSEEYQVRRAKDWESFLSHIRTRDPDSGPEITTVGPFSPPKDIDKAKARLLADTLGVDVSEAEKIQPIVSAFSDSLFMNEIYSLARLLIPNFTPSVGWYDLKSIVHAAMGVIPSDFDKLEVPDQLLLVRKAVDAHLGKTKLGTKELETPQESSQRNDLEEACKEGVESLQNHPSADDQATDTAEYVFRQAENLWEVAYSSEIKLLVDSTPIQTIHFLLKHDWQDLSLVSIDSFGKTDTPNASDELEGYSESLREAFLRLPRDDDEEEEEAEQSHDSGYEATVETESREESERRYLKGLKNLKLALDDTPEHDKARREGITAEMREVAKELNALKFETPYAKLNPELKKVADRVRDRINRGIDLFKELLPDLHKHLRATIHPGKQSWTYIPDPTNKPHWDLQ